MAKDADGNYYYDAGTVNEQFDNVAVTEDADGNLSMTVNGDEMRVEEFAHVFGGARAAPTGGDLAAGESMLFVDSSDSGLKLAHATDDSTVNLNVIVADVTA